MKTLRMRLTIFLGIVIGCIESQVIEVDETFKDVKKEDAWLMEFYAPWCGHCKHLEPVYHQVSLELRGTRVKVARVDATIHPSMASLYEVRGFPTIKFIQRDMVIDFTGERSKEALVQFAKRALRPAVNSITSREHFEEMQLKLHLNVFFVLVTSAPDDDAAVDAPDNDDGGDRIIEEQFKNASHRNIISNDFFSLSSLLLLPQSIQVTKTPTILAVRQDDYRQIPEEMLRGGVEKWVGEEKWGWVATVGAMSLNELNSLGKNLIMLVHEEQKEHFEMMFKVAKQNKQLSSTNQFVHLTDVEVGNNIIMDDLPSPFFFIFSPSSRYFFLPLSPIQSVEELLSFIGDVEEGRVQAMGGRGGVEKVKRLVYGVKNVFYTMWMDSAWLTALVLGVPCFIVGIIVYTMCCMEVGEEGIFHEDGAAGDEEEGEEEEEEEGEEEDEDEGEDARCSDEGKKMK